jgi:16S rRNA (cytidine1402-2'-O)-methyltransferase
LGTLYVSSLPAGDLDDWPLRAQRMLREVSLVVASDYPSARRKFEGLPLALPLVELAGVDTHLAALETGDLMLLLDGGLDSPTAPAQALIRAAVDHSFAVVSVPGPTLPVTALVVSGLPANSFLYLGPLPEEPPSRHQLLASVADEKRTLVVVARGLGPDLWASLFSAFGRRPVTVSSGPDLASGATWRGMLDERPEVEPDVARLEPHILVIGGAPVRPAHWTEDHLRSEIRARLSQGLDVRQTARQLAAQSGWPRRAIYRLAVQDARPSRESHGETKPPASNGFR